MPQLVNFPISFEEVILVSTTSNERQFHDTPYAENR